MVTALIFPLVVALVADADKQKKIIQVARSLQYGVEWIARQEQLAPLDSPEPIRQLGEPLVGPAAALVDRLSRLQPALVIFDLDNEDIPWRKWTAIIKSVPATRRLVVVCFGSDGPGASLDVARRIGVELALEGGQFFDRLPEIIRQYSRLVDAQALEATCQAPLLTLARHGLELFNQGEYFEAHEVLEAAWNEDATPGRELYRAILQVAVAYLQIERGNYRGAVKMFWRVRQWIDPLPDVCRGVEVARLRQDAERVYRQLIEAGPEGMPGLRSMPFPPVHYEITV